ncbi:cleavage stimulating factor 64-like isoform X1 [Zingiber officinale]|uniref:cleavage stimulating factor 64-like isoform X1 n=1 Tax=Zingiber officinale TaxID=94328 RepID=UPI001C4A8B3A|nr:cleavage stimulating factor 64-like isoform X1 [Zingiber officinale]
MAAQHSQQQQQQQMPAGDGLTSQFANLPKAQLYEIMSQMKVLIDQNQKQARQILIDNPQLTRALFQAQIMLGMVQPPKVMPNLQQQQISQPQPAQIGQPSNAQDSQKQSAKLVGQGEPSLSQNPPSARPQQLTQPSQPLPVASVPSLTGQSLQIPLPPSAPQAKGFPPMQIPSVPAHSSHHPSLTLPAPGPPHNSTLPSHMPMVSVQPQQSLQNPGIFNQALQPPLPLQPRPMQTFNHQLQPHMAHSLAFQPPNVPHQLPLHNLFNPGAGPSASFLQGQLPLPNQLLPQHIYQQQVGSHLGPDYGNQIGNAMQIDRGTPWAPGPSELSKMGAQVPGLAPLMASGQMAGGSSGQPPRPPPLTPEMEKALLQQVMSLTPEQIHLLPPEQRNQVFQLQDMLR